MMANLLTLQPSERALLTDNEQSITGRGMKSPEETVCENVADTIISLKKFCCYQG